jgi:hypothetical protein
MSPSDPAAPSADVEAAANAQRQIRRAERMAYVWYTLFALAALVGLSAIWPKYLARREKLLLNYEGRERAYEYRVEQRQRAIEAAQAEGQAVPSLSGLTWPVILAGASVALPLVALVVSLAVGRPAAPPPRGPPGDAPQA